MTNKNQLKLSGKSSFAFDTLLLDWTTLIKTEIKLKTVPGWNEKYYLPL